MSTRVELDTSGFMNSMMKQLQALDADIKSVTEKALKETHAIITAKAEEAAQNSNLPAGGKYSTGKMLQSLYRDGKVVWTGTVAAVDVGFSIRNGGLPSLFMIYGTPKYMNNQKMYDAFKCKATLDEVRTVQEEIFYDEVRRLK